MLSMLPAETSKWQSVGRKTDRKPKQKAGKETKTPDVRPEKVTAVASDPAFAVLDASWKTEQLARAYAEDASNSDADEPATSSTSPANPEPLRAANGSAPKAKAAREPKKPKVKKQKTSIGSVAEDLAAGPLQDAINSLQDKYAADQGVQLEVLASYLLNSFKECELPFNKLLQEQSLAQAAESPLQLVSEEFVGPISAYLKQCSLPALSVFAKQLLLAVLEGLPDSINGKAQPPKAKVGLLLASSILLRTRPTAALLLCDDLLAGGPTYTSPGHLPVLLWAFSQTSRGNPGVGAALWVRVLLPQVAGLSGASQMQVKRYVDDFVTPQLTQVAAAAAAGFEVPAQPGSKKATALLPVLLPGTLDTLARSLGGATPSKGARAAADEETYQVLRQVVAQSNPEAFSFPELARLSIDAVNGAEEPSARLVELAAGQLVVALQRDDASFGVWENRHKGSLRGSSRVLAYLSSVQGSKASPLAPLLRDTKKRGKFRAMLGQLRQRHHNYLASGKGWQGACARAANEACNTLQRSRAPKQVGGVGSSSGGRSATLASLAVLSVVAAAVAIVKVDSVQQQAVQVLGPEAVAQVQQAYVAVSAKLGPYVDQVVAVTQPYVQQASEAVHPYLQQAAAAAAPYVQQASEAVQPYLQQAATLLKGSS